MKKLFIVILNPLFLAALSLLIVSSLFRYYLYANSKQLIREFKNQNYKELYSADTVKISSRLSSLSTVINWVCLEGNVAKKSFFKMEKGNCKTNLLQQKQMITIPQANDIQIIFTTRLSQEIEHLFFVFIFLQTVLIAAIIYSIKKSEEEKRQNEVRINKLARQMFHDIRSPLATINTVISSTDDLMNDKNLLNSAIQRMNDIANNLLNISKKDSNHISREPPKLHLKNINETVLDIINEKIIEYSSLPYININFSLPPYQLWAELDHSELQRIISNLINNSIEARIANSPINIHCSLTIIQKGFIQIKIEDNGKGIPSKFLSILGKKEFTNKKFGNGIGLIHAFESINSWNGEISVTSKLNQGTQILISLPMLEPDNDLTILLDDDELVRLTWESSAKKNGQELITISNPEQLFEIITTLSPIKTTFYIDSHLGNNKKGELLALELFEKGFSNLYITSGHPKEHFHEFIFLKGVRDKSPPWKSYK